MGGEMSNWSHCFICDRDYFGNTIPHACGPCFWVNIEEYHGEGNWRTIYALSPEEAAEVVAADYDNGDYSLIKGGSVDVRVREKENGPIAIYEVTAEAAPSYNAREK